MNIELITLITVIVGITAIIKFLFDFKKELSDFKDETRKEINELKIEIVKLQHRFDVSEGKQTDIEKQLAEVKTETSTRFNQIETENKNYIKEIMNKVLEAFPKSAL